MFTAWEESRSLAFPASRRTRHGPDFDEMKNTLSLYLPQRILRVPKRCMLRTDTMIDCIQIVWLKRRQFTAKGPLAERRDWRLAMACVKGRVAGVQNVQNPANIPWRGRRRRRIFRTCNGTEGPFKGKKNCRDAAGTCTGNTSPVDSRLTILAPIYFFWLSQTLLLF